MKAFEIGVQQGLESLRAVRHADLSPGPGEALVQVHATCLGHRDLKVLEGTYGPRRLETRIPLSEGVGHVAALGEGVTAPAIGTRVVCGHFARWIDGAFDPSAFGHDLGITHDGWLAEQMVVPADALVTLRDTVSDEQAVGLAASGLTSWNALVEVGRIKAGDTVLTLGTGGVSILALQIAKMHGARVVVTSSNDEKLALARALGADLTINYRSHPEWAKEMLRLSGGRGADIIVETGGSATLTHSITAAAPNARIVMIGALAGADLALPNFSTIVGKNLTIRGITAGNRQMLQALVRAAETNRLRPVIGQRFEFDDAPAAYQSLKEGRHIGKVMIQVT